MSLKTFWNKLKYWQRGGLIGFLIITIVFVGNISLDLIGKSRSFTNIIYGQGEWTMFFFILAILPIFWIVNFDVPFYVYILIGFIFYFVVGTLIGWIIGKFIKK